MVGLAALALPRAPPILDEGVAFSTPFLVEGSHFCTFDLAFLLKGSHF